MTAPLLIGSTRSEAMRRHHADRLARKSARSHPLVRQIFEAAQQEGISLRDLSSRSGVNARTIADWLTRGSPGLTNIVAVAHSLGYNLTLTRRREP